MQIDSSSSELHTRYMQMALELAVKAQELGEVPVGAVLVINDAVIGEGFNRPIIDHDPSAHAEIMAIRDAAKKIKNYRLSGSTLYVTLEPCSMCVGAMIHARVERLVFAAFEPRAGAVVSAFQLLQSPHYNHQIEVIEGVLQEKSSIMLKKFFKQRRKNKP